MYPKIYVFSLEIGTLEGEDFFYQRNNFIILILSVSFFLKYHSLVKSTTFKFQILQTCGVCIPTYKRSIECHKIFNHIETRLTHI